jgi:two-component system chemotaxis response regulator CheY
MNKFSAEIAQKHFLVVDDFQSMHVMMAAQLKFFGVTKITFARSGTEAFATIKGLQASGTPIDFVIADMMMKDGSGIDLTKLIRSDVTSKNLPILMISSMSDINKVLEAVQAGVDDYIVKPWQEADLFKKIVTLAGQAK